MIRLALMLLLAAPALAASPPEVAPASERHEGLLNPSKAHQEAPATYQVKFETTKGDFVVEVNRDWAPGGADRFYTLTTIGFFDGVAFFRNIEGFMVQFGVNGEGMVNEKWKKSQIPDDRVIKSNKPGYLSFASAGPNSRTTQVFINHGQNGSLDGMGFSPFGKIVQGAEVVASLYKGYGEGQPRGYGPNQSTLKILGNDYLAAEFPELDYVIKATVMAPAEPPAEPAAVE